MLSMGLFGHLDIRKNGDGSEANIEMKGVWYNFKCPGNVCTIRQK